jgi:hypothetical protein
MPEFQKFDAGLMGIYVDGVWCHNAFARDRDISAVDRVAP